MSKAHRGFGVRELVKNGRGTCPLCKRTGIKIIFEYENEGKKHSLCKQCNAALRNGKLKEQLASL